METLISVGPFIAVMLLLMGLSALFSSAEAAFFYLKLEDRKRFRNGTTAQKAAAQLLSDPDRLLSAILFWNLMINVAYFAFASIVGIRLEAVAGTSVATIFSSISLLAIIFCSEMVPKSLAVLRASSLASLLAIPIAFAVRVMDPIKPILRSVSTISQRLLWPGFQTEPYMQVADLERAIQISLASDTVLEQEELALRGIVALSDSSVSELMRPRMQFRMFHPPVSLSDLGGELTPSGYLFISDDQGDDIVSALNLLEASELSDTDLQEHAQEVLVFPWCAKAAEVLQRMLATENEVAAVVNELGETMGVVTLRDLLHSIFVHDRGRHEMIHPLGIAEVDPGVYEAVGMNSIRQLTKFFQLEVPETRHATINGVLQEQLERIPQVGDEVEWGPFHFVVQQELGEGQIMVRLALRAEQA